MHVNRAPAAGTGKSYLSDIASSIVSGVTRPVTRMKTRRDGKVPRLGNPRGNSAHKHRQRERRASGNPICQVVTQGTVAPRILQVRNMIS